MYDAAKQAKLASLKWRLNAIKHLLEKGKVIQAHAIASDTRP